MPTSDADIRDAVAILRGLKKRVDRLEERPKPEGPVNQIRVVTEAASGDESVSSRFSDASVAETVSADEAVTRTTRTAGSFVWGSDKWSFTEWATPGAALNFTAHRDQPVGVSATVVLVHNEGGLRSNEEIVGMANEAGKTITKNLAN